MTREEAKNWLNKLYARSDITDEYGDMEDMQPYEEAVNMAIKALEQEPKWIPVSERLPEKNVEVLATTTWGAITIAERYSANDFFIHEGTTNADIDEVLAWMPLPEPYKAESEDKE